MSRQREEELRRTGKFPMKPLSRRGSRKRELSATRIEVDFYVSTMKEEQLLKLAETFKVSNDIVFHIPTPSYLPG